MSALGNKLRDLAAEADALDNTSGGIISATIPPPLPVDPNAKVDGHYGEISWYSDGGNRVDNIVAPGTRGTVTLPLTGHVLSLPQIGEENLTGYVNRTRAQCGHPGAWDVGAFTAGGGGTYAASQFGGFKADGSNWPRIADWLFNRSAYMAGVPGTAGVPLVSYYPTEAALRAAVTASKTTQAVNFDDQPIQGGFGPAIEFWTQLDRTIGRTKPATRPSDLPPGETEL
jgi:hypothetical protein